MIVGETEGLVKIIAEKDADGRAGRILGVHMVGPWVTEQLGQGYLAVNWEATVDEVAALHPAPPDDERAVRRVVLAHRPPARRRSALAWLTSRCPSSVRPSPRARSPSGSSRSATRSPRTRSLFEVSTDKVDSEVPSPRRGYVTEILVPEGETVDVGAVLAVIGDAAARRRRRRPTPPRPRPRPRRPRPKPRPSAGRRRSTGRSPRPSPPTGAEPSRPSPSPSLPPRRAEKPKADPRRGRAGRRRRRRQAAVAGRAAADRRARPRPGHDHRAPAPAGASRATTCWRSSRSGGAGGERAPARRAAPRPSSAAAPPAQRPRTGARARRGRASATRSIPFIEHPQAHRRAHDAVEGDVGPRVRGDRGRLRARRAGAPRPTGRVEGARRASASPTCRSSSRAVVDAIREFPRSTPRSARRADRAQLREPRHRRRPRLQGADRPGHPRRRRQAPARHRPRGQRPRRPRARQEARRRRHLRRHVHDHQPRPVRHAAHAADHQPAAGRDPVDRRREAAARSSSTLPDGSEGIAIHSVGNLALTWDHRAFDGAYAAAFLAKVKEILETRDWAAEL